MRHREGWKGKTNNTITDELFALGLSGAEWGRLNKAFETCQNCGGQNMDAKNSNKEKQNCRATDFKNIEM